MNKLDIIRGKIIYAESKKDAAEIIKIFTDMGAGNEHGYKPLPRMGYFIGTKNQIRPTVDIGVSLKEFKELLKHFDYPKMMLVSDYAHHDGSIMGGVKRLVVTANENGYYTFDENKEEITNWRYAEEIKEPKEVNNDAINLLEQEIRDLKYELTKIEYHIKELKNEV